MFRSLAFKAIVPVVFMQALIMMIAGAYYINRFSDDIDNRIESQIKIPGKLMNQGLLNFEALSKKNTMIQIVGSDLVESMVIGYDKTVYYSIDPKDLGKNVSQLDRVIDLKDFTGSEEDLLIKDSDNEGNYIASISPIYSVVGKAPFLFAYIKIRTESSENQKNTLKIIFFVGSLLSALMSFGAVTFILRVVFLANVKKLRTAVEMVGKGNLGHDVVETLPHTSDELGILSKGFENMVVEIRKSREGLEQEVLKRTEELKKSQSELQVKFEESKKFNTELERMNRLMIDRELKMIELKKEISSLKGL